MHHTPQTEAERLEALQLKPFSDKRAVEDRKILDAGRPTCVIKSTSTVAQPDPSKLPEACLFVRYEAAAVVDGPDNKPKAIFLAPGQLIPAFRRSGNAWVQVLRCLEIRAYALPMYNKEVLTMGKQKPQWNDLEALANAPASRELRLSVPGGETRLRPHPRIPGAFPMKRYDGATVARQLDCTQMQSGDFIRLFGEMPLIEMKEREQFPFRFVTGNLDAQETDTTSGFGTLFASSSVDETAANPLTGGMISGLKSANLPISFVYAEDYFDGDFDPTEYEAKVRDELEGESWIFIQHRISPYFDTDVEDALGYCASGRVRAPFAREELPPGAFLNKWESTDFRGPRVYTPLAPYAYDQAWRLMSGGSAKA